MDPTLLFFLCLLAPINTSDVTAESVAIVNLQKCLELAPTRQHDMGILSTDIEVTDREAKRLLNHQKKMESLSRRENATELDELNAKVAKLEFDAFCQRERPRIKEAEEAMFKKWHKQVNAAAKLVAQREAITVVLCLGTDLNDIEVSANGLKQTHVGFLHSQTRPDITDKIVEEMKTAAFVESVEKRTARANNKMQHSCRTAAHPSENQHLQSVDHCLSGSKQGHQENGRGPEVTDVDRCDDNDWHRGFWLGIPGWFIRWCAFFKAERDVCG